jgi:hypothetical protein
VVVAELLVHRGDVGSMRVQGIKTQGLVEDPKVLQWCPPAWLLLS